MTAMDDERLEYRCSFCRGYKSRADRLFAGPSGVFICDECVSLGSEIVAEQRQAVKRIKRRPRWWTRWWRH